MNDVPRIHCGEDVTRGSHSIVSKDPELIIPLRIKCIFSAFKKRKLTSEEMSERDEVEIIHLSADDKTLDPHCESYADNEDGFLDFRGDLKYPPPAKKK